MKNFLYFDRGDKKKEADKKVFFFKLYTKVKCIKKKWVLVFSFMYLVSVDPMDRSQVLLMSSQT